ncbi:13507_t:CDS:1 [Funneliformis caledonium]|uniref:13507_t:CDS:1 n=1 Tax=Funneliformis caledonium TaxID=1117310 RepID=A0A9N9HS63_9GLOM|nr:13507_t:CDS:1 [Funneliformis caledonium]
MTQRIALQKRITTNISSVIQREECSQARILYDSQNNINQILPNLLNCEDDNSESLEDLSDKSQYTNYETSSDFHDFVSNFSTASDTLSNDDRSMIIEEIERIIEPTQTIVDSETDF